MIIKQPGLIRPSTSDRLSQQTGENRLMLTSARKSDGSSVETLRQQMALGMKGTLTRKVSGVVNVMGSATSTAWHIHSGRPTTLSNLLPARASSSTSSRSESAANSTCRCR